MGITEKAKEYLIKDILTNCGLLQVINRGSAEILQADNTGVLLFDNIGEAHMLSALYTEDTVKWFNNLNCDLVFLTERAFIPYLRSLYGFNNLLECHQFVYTDKKPLMYEKRLDIGTPTDEEMKIIRQYYNKLSDNELMKIRSLGNLYSAREATQSAQGSMIGFVGSHLEGSMGLLEILPEYRRLGYGTELECFIINNFLEKGLIPFCQVEINNDKSMKLQNKLNLTKASGNVYWLY